MQFKEAIECPICNTAVDLHPPGPCLDAWLSKEVLKEEVRWVEDSTGSKRPDLPGFSTDIASAWIVVRKLREERAAESIDLTFREGRFGVRFSRNQEFTWSDREPLAICKAAIKAMC
jgi:hypothetical protein